MSDYNMEGLQTRLFWLTFKYKVLWLDLMSFSFLAKIAWIGSAYALLVIGISPDLET